MPQIHRIFELQKRVTAVLYADYGQYGNLGNVYKLPEVQRYYRMSIALFKQLGSPIAQTWLDTL